jgi:hypothetical protein
MPRPEEVSAAILSQMEALFGPLLMAVLLKELQENYFGDEFDVKRAIAERPDLFERALHGILGKAGTAIMAIVCRKV